MENIEISDDKSKLDVSKIHQFLTSESEWANNITIDIVTQSIENSICIGAYIRDVQIGFCRIITDCATFANLVDVIVWPEFRGQGISKHLMNAVLNHASVKNVRRFTLATSDAHGLYKKFGFTPLNKPDTFMEIYKPDVYKSSL